MQRIILKSQITQIAENSPAQMFYIVKNKSVFMINITEIKAKILNVMYEFYYYFFFFLVIHYSVEGGQNDNFHLRKVTHVWFLRIENG